MTFFAGEPATQSPLRVVLVTETFLPKVDGIVTRLCNTLRHFVSGGNAALLIAPKGVDGYEGAAVHGVPGFSFPLYPELKLAVPRGSIGRAIEEFQPDVIHAVNPVVLGTSAFYYSASKKIPLVVSYHTHLPKYVHYYGAGKMEPLLWWGMRQGYNRADLTLATSTAMQTELERNGIERVQVWQRGVDTERFHPRHASAGMRERLTQGHPRDKLLLYVGRLSAEKEIERCRDVIAAVPGLRLALVGDGPHRATLEQYFAGTPTFFAGFMAGTELASAFASADVFILPSRTETLGLVLLESMAAGCPVVTPRSGGTSDIVQDGITGHLYDPDDPDGPVAAVRKLFENQAHAEALRLQARADAERWGWAAATRQLEGYYREVLDREIRLSREIALRKTSGASHEVICSELRISRATLRRHAGMNGGYAPVEPQQS